jgi:hypothetical protein
VNEKTRSACRYGLGALAVFVLTFGYLFVQVFNLSGDVDHNGDSARKALSVASQAQQQTDQLKQSVEEANRRLAAAGKPTVPVPTLTPLPTVPPPTDGLTSSQLYAVRGIVAAELSSQHVTLSQAEISQIARVAALLIPKPKDGVTPTAAQLQPLVTATVAAYCTSDRCVGKAGPTGPAGGEGRQGPDGKPAPAVTDEQLYAQAQKALLAYCSLDSKPCQGPAGPTGPQGPQGPKGNDAVSITDTDCVGDGSDSYWRIAYSDGTTGTATGPCRVAVLPPVTPPT